MVRYDIQFYISMTSVAVPRKVLRDICAQDPEAPQRCARCAWFKALHLGKL